jgi:hypothetical protein
MNRKLRIECLERRLVLSGDSLSDYIDLSELEVMPTYTTQDSPANHVTGTGTSFDGVARLDIDTNIGSGLGSGVLLWTGRHVLTAAHNITGSDDVQFTLIDMDVVFELPIGNVTFGTSSIDVHPDWDPDDLLLGSDLAILTLDDTAPDAIPRFDIYRGSSELNAVGDKAGYGQSGQGVVSIAAGTKRDGQNE